MFSRLLAVLFVFFYSKKLWMNVHEIFGKSRRYYREQSIRFFLAFLLS